MTEKNDALRIVVGSHSNRQTWRCLPSRRQRQNEDVSLPEGLHHSQAPNAATLLLFVFQAGSNPFSLIRFEPLGLSRVIG